MFDSVFEGFAIWFKDSLSELDVQALITPTLGSGWQARPFGDPYDNKTTRVTLNSSRSGDISEVLQRELIIQQVCVVIFMYQKELTRWQPQS
jgi:hypothetical protein